MKIICLTFFETKCEILFRNVLFDHNHAIWTGGAVHIRTSDFYPNDVISDFQFIMEQVTLESNWAKSKHSWNGNGGAIDLSIEDPGYSCRIVLNDLNLYNNTSDGHGGGLAFSVPQGELNIHLTNSIFTNNEVRPVSRGGALFLSLHSSEKMITEKLSEITIENTTFENNIAGEGGSIYQATPKSSPGRFVISNCKFFCCNSSSFVYPVEAKNGCLLFASLATHFHQVIFRESATLGDSICSAPGLVLDDQGNYHHFQDVTYTCSRTNLYYKKPTVNNSVSSLVINCQQCTYLPYTFGNGTLTIKDTSVHEPEDEATGERIVGIREACMPCLFGGDCSEGRVIARPNYWGYHNHKGLKEFQSCPQGYCCNNINVKCTSYNTCAQDLHC